VDARAAAYVSARRRRSSALPRLLAGRGDGDASQRTARPALDRHRPRQGTIAVNRGLVAVAYELHETRGKTRNARRPINLDATTIAVLRAWQTWQRTEQRAVGNDDHGWVFTDPSGQPVHPHAISHAFERIAIRAGLPVIRLHDIRHTHATLLAQAGVHPKVVSERLGHADAKFTIETYQHVMPGMQRDAAAMMRPTNNSLLPPRASTGPTRLKPRKNTA
jgi:Phage integrase family